MRCSKQHPLRSFQWRETVRQGATERYPAFNICCEGKAIAPYLGIVPVVVF
jgi:hypothetical protein